LPALLAGARAPTRSMLAVKDAFGPASRRPSAVLDCEPLSIG